MKPDYYQLLSPLLSPHYYMQMPAMTVTLNKNETKTMIKTYDLKLTLVEAENLYQTLGRLSWTSGLNRVYDRVSALVKQIKLDDEKRAALGNQIASLREQISARNFELVSAEKQLAELG